MLYYNELLPVTSSRCPKCPLPSKAGPGGWATSPALLLLLIPCGSSSMAVDATVLSSSVLDMVSVGGSSPDSEPVALPGSSGTPDATLHNTSRCIYDLLIMTMSC